VTLKSPSVEELGKCFNIPREQLEAFVAFYNADFSAYDNSVYSRIESRIAHWLNYAKHGWFDERIDVGLNALQRLLDEGKTFFIDVGFSVAYLYTRPALAANKDLSCLFIDKHESAKSFYVVISEALGLVWRSRFDSVSIADVEVDGAQELLVSTAEQSARYHGSSSAFVMASEVLEHLIDAESFWIFLAKLKVALSIPMKAYVTLPVGAKIPSHNLEFLSPDSAIKYLGKYAHVESAVVLTPPPGPSVSKFLSACVCAHITVV